VFPKPNVAGALSVTEATEQLSVVTGAPKATPVAEHRVKSAGTVTFAGQVIVGN
jgi:hypothetical protein